MFSIWQKIKDAMINKQASKPTITSVPLPAQTKNVNNPSQTGNVVSVQNAQSWAPDLHPNGRENSSYINNIDYNNGTLDVEFRDGTKIELNNIDPDDAKEFAQADSKGRFYNQNFRDKPYKVI